MRKGEVYAQVLEQARVLFEGQRNWVSFAIPHPFSFLLVLFRDSKVC
jgi:hypothetical protein